MANWGHSSSTSVEGNPTIHHLMYTIHLCCNNLWNNGTRRSASFGRRSLNSNELSLHKRMPIGPWRRFILRGQELITNILINLDPTKDFKHPYVLINISPIWGHSGWWNHLFTHGEVPHRPWSPGHVLLHADNHTHESVPFLGGYHRSPPFVEVHAPHHHALFKKNCPHCRVVH